MTLLRDGIKYGAMFGIAREAGKSFNKHEEQKQNPQYQQYQQQPPQYQQQQQYQPQQFRDQSGYLHQAWCNGQCNSQCNGAAVSGGK